MKIHTFTRRQFLSVCASATALGLTACTKQTTGAHDSDDTSADTNVDTGIREDTDTPPDQGPDSPTADKPAVVWIQAQDCAGCTESVLASTSFHIGHFLLDDVALRYHATLMNGTGRMAEEMLDAAVDAGDFILVVEGSFPGADPRFLMSGGGALEEKFTDAARYATAVIALGSCAAFGGIPRAGVTEGQSVQDVMNRQDLSTALINLPGCPVHPTWFFDTTALLLEGTMPELDDHLRPLAHFGKLVHDQCPRKDTADSALYVSDWNSTIQRGRCLRAKGCRGKETYSSCPTLMWNGIGNWCIGSNAPCAGCTEPDFYNGKNPLYVEQTKK